jgi:hypothetical protein
MEPALPMSVALYRLERLHLRQQPEKPPVVFDPLQLPVQPRRRNLQRVLAPRNQILHIQNRPEIPAERCAILVRHTRQLFHSPAALGAPRPGLSKPARRVSGMALPAVGRCGFTTNFRLGAPHLALEMWVRTCPGITRALCLLPQLPPLLRVLLYKDAQRPVLRSPGKLDLHHIESM